MPFSFLQRGNLADHAKQMSLSLYTPEIRLEGLSTGVDNVRIDVYLSPRFCEATRSHVAKLLAKYGNVEDFLQEDPFSVSARQMEMQRTSGFVGSPKTP